MCRLLSKNSHIRPRSSLPTKRIIHEASKKYTGLAWYAYDIAFRKLAAKNPALNRTECHPAFGSIRFPGFAGSICFVCGSADHLSDLCPVSSSRFGNQPRLSNQRVPSAAISMGDSRAPKTCVPSRIAVTMQTVADDTAPMNTMTPALQGHSMSIHHGVVTRYFRFG